MKRVYKPFARWRQPGVVGLVCAAVTLAGCNSGDTGAGKPAATGPSKPVSASPAEDGKSPLQKDTTSRRQHQKEQTGKPQ